MKDAKWLAAERARARANARTKIDMAQVHRRLRQQEEVERARAERYRQHVEAENAATAAESDRRRKIEIETQRAKAARAEAKRRKTIAKQIAEMNAAAVQAELTEKEQARIKQRAEQSATVLRQKPKHRIERGRRIEGTTMLRDFCCGCGGAMRVHQLLPNPFCSDCLTGTTATTKHNTGRRAGRLPEVADMQYHGGQFSQGEW